MSPQEAIDRIMAIKNNGRRRRELKDFAKHIRKLRLEAEAAQKRAKRAQP